MLVRATEEPEIPPPGRQIKTSAICLTTPSGRSKIYAAPRRWAEQAYPNLIHYNRLPKGGHFAAWEQPELFCDEVRATFRSLR
jgi:hypothetical protein